MLDVSDGWSLVLGEGRLLDVDYPPDAKAYPHGYLYWGRSFPFSGHMGMEEKAVGDSFHFSEILL